MTIEPTTRNTTAFEAMAEMAGVAIACTGAAAGGAVIAWAAFRAVNVILMFAR